MIYPVAFDLWPENLHYTPRRVLHYTPRRVVADIRLQGWPDPFNDHFMLFILFILLKMVIQQGFHVRFALGIDILQDNCHYTPRRVVEKMN